MAAIASPPNDAADFPLPQMRQDIELLDGWPDHSGSPTWMLFDPMRNLYFRVGRDVFQMLSVWGDATLGKVQLALRSRFQRRASEEEVGEVIKLLFANQLTIDPPSEGHKSFAEQEKLGKKGLFNQALHNYLFFRIPLFRPDRFLRFSWPLVAPLFSRTAAFFSFRWECCPSTWCRANGMPLADSSSRSCRLKG